MFQKEIEEIWQYPLKQLKTALPFDTVFPLLGIIFKEINRCRQNAC